jgi:hypothetical protein
MPVRLRRPGRRLAVYDSIGANATAVGGLVWTLGGRRQGSALNLRSASTG